MHLGGGRAQVNIRATSPSVPVATFEKLFGMQAGAPQSADFAVNTSEAVSKQTHKSKKKEEKTFFKKSLSNCVQPDQWIFAKQN